MATSDIKKGPLYVDSTNNVIGVGTSSPSTTHKLTLNHTANYGGISLKQSGTQIGQIIQEGGTGNVYIDADSSSLGGGLIFRTTGGTERARVTANGITFNGDTAAANALNDYEEGTWTPVLKGSNSATKTWSYSAQSGYYTKVGNQVTVYFNIQLSSNGSGTDGNAYIDGLPFVSSNLTNLTNFYGFFWKQLIETGDVALQGRNQVNTSTIALQDGSSSYPDIAPLNTSVFTNDRRIRGTFTYTA